MAAIDLQVRIFLLREALSSIISLGQTFMMCIYVLFAHSRCVNYLYRAVNVKGAETVSFESVRALNLWKLITFFFFFLATCM